MTNFQNVHSCLLVYFPTKPRGVGQKELCQHILQCYLGRSGLLFCGFVICECKTEKKYVYWTGYRCFSQNVPVTCYLYGVLTLIILRSFKECGCSMSGDISQL